MIKGVTLVRLQFTSLEMATFLAAVWYNKLYDCVGFCCHDFCCVAVKLYSKLLFGEQFILCVAHCLSRLLSDCRVSATKCDLCMPISPSTLSFRRMELWWRSGTFWGRSTSAVSEWGVVSVKFVCLFFFLLFQHLSRPEMALLLLRVVRDSSLFFYSCQSTFSLNPLWFHHQ